VWIDPLNLRPLTVNCVLLPSINIVPYLCPKYLCWSTYCCNFTWMPISITRWRVNASNAPPFNSLPNDTKKTYWYWYFLPGSVENSTNEGNYLGVIFQSWFCSCKKFFQIILDIFGLLTIGANWVWSELQDVKIGRYPAYPYNTTWLVGRLGGFLIFSKNVTYKFCTK